MKKKLAFLIQTSKRIPPFEDSMGDVFINQKTLCEWQDDALIEAGFIPCRISRQEDIKESDYPCLVLTDDLFFTAEVIRAFYSLCEKNSGSTQCAVSAHSVSSKLAFALQERESDEFVSLPLYYMRSASPVELKQIIIDMGEFEFSINLPHHMQGDIPNVMPICLRPVIQITHAVDILFANIGCLNARFAVALASTARKIGLVIRARSTQQSRLLACMNEIGPGCDIHPTAYLEGASIGANVHIGANAVIRMSSLGDGCDIGDGSVVKHSVVGSGSVVYDNFMLAFSVCYPETFLIHGPYQFSVFGRSSAVFDSLLDDYRLDGKPIRIEVDNKYVPHPLRSIGCFIGHRTRIAGGCIINPGRIIPNDLLIFPSPSGTLTYIDSDLPKNIPLFIQDGRLQSLSDQIHGSGTADEDDALLNKIS